MDASYSLIPLQTTESLSRKPFGLLDPTLGTPARMLEEFVDFGGDYTRYGGLAVTGPDTDTLLFVGPPGSGRTTYMRRASFLGVESHEPGQEEERQMVSIGLDDENVPSMGLIHEVCKWYQEAEVVNRIQKLWRAAALRVLVAHLLVDPRLEHPLLGEALAHFEGRFGELLELGDNDGQPSESIYGQLGSIVERHDSADGLTAYLNSTHWDELESHLGTVLTSAPRVTLYVDAFDQEARHAPAHWLTWEKALFYQVLHFARSKQLAQRFRLVAAVSDVTYAAVREGLRETKYFPGEAIRLLRWSREATLAFLMAKVRKLNSNWLMRPNRLPSPTESWLGTAMIENARLGKREAIEDYVVSHSRYSPRDIVHLGNVLSEEVVAARVNGESQVPDKRIRARVEELALATGHEQLGIAAADVAGEELAGSLDAFTEFYNPDRDEDEVEASEGVRRLADAIEDVVRAVGARYFTRSMFDAAVESSNEEELKSVDLLSVLWRNGLVARWQWTDEGYRPIFFTAGLWDRQRLPSDEKYFVFHRSLLDVTGIDPVGSTELVRRSLYVAGSTGQVGDVARLLDSLARIYDGLAGFFGWVGEVAEDDWLEGQDLENLRVGQVRLTSPGFWVFGGNGKLLEAIRQILADRHSRRQDREYREPAEEEKLSLENERARLENMLLAQNVVKGDIAILRKAGKSPEEIAARVDAVLDSGTGFLSAINRVIDPGSARMLEPGEPPTDFSDPPQGSAGS